MSDNITLKRSTVASWLRELSMFSNCDPSPMVDAVCEELAAALAAPQPEPQPLKEDGIIALAEVSGIPPGYRASMILGHTNVAWIFEFARTIESAVLGEPA